MPIYKISRRGRANQRERAAFARMRLVALLLSACLTLGTIFMFICVARR